MAVNDYTKVDVVGLTESTTVPSIGLVSFSTEKLEVVTEKVQAALERGIRYLEISELFSNGHAIVDAINQSGIPRCEFFISMKVWPKKRTPSLLSTSIKKYINTIHLDYLDLVMVHAPIDVSNRFDQWKTMEELKTLGLTRLIGLSNTSMVDLMTILKNYAMVPSILEMGVNVFCQEKDLVDFCNSSQIVVVSTNPLCKGIRPRKDGQKEYLESIANENGISVEEILVRWCVTKGIVPLIPENNDPLSVISFADLANPLDNEIMKILDELDEELKTSWNPKLDDDE